MEGLQATFFSEAYVSHEPEKAGLTSTTLTFPRICALARIAWSGNEGGGGPTAGGEGGLLPVVGMGAFFRCFPPEGRLCGPEGGGRQRVFTVTTDDRAEIFTSSDGSDTEHRYLAPVRTDKPWTYRFYTVTVRPGAPMWRMIRVGGRSARRW